MNAVAYDIYAYSGKKYEVQGDTESTLATRWIFKLESQLVSFL